MGIDIYFQQEKNSDYKNKISEMRVHLHKPRFIPLKALVGLECCSNLPETLELQLPPDLFRPHHSFT